MSCFKGLIPMIYLIMMSSGIWGKPNVRRIGDFDIRRQIEEDLPAKQDQDEEVVQMPIGAVVEPDVGDAAEPDTGDAAGGGLDDKVKKVVDTCFCPLQIEPVCGSDGVTYPNKFCVKCNTTGVVIAHQGACNKDDKLRAKFKISKNPYNQDEDLPFPCYCPDVEDLVCDADGDTHYNEHCMKCRKPRMTISKKGPCDTDDARYGNR